MAEQYSLFSTVYDMFMDNVPYIEWADSIEQTLKKHGINEGIVLDLGCGTGTLTKMLADKGYDMIGVDSSEEMLSIAKGKDDNTLFLCQDISEFELYGTVRAVISTCDTLNYILDEEELINTFKLVNNYLEPGGIFVFDMNAPEKYEEVLSDNVFAENRDEAS
ncbi:MAG: class I SAM-dependent methyltransferase, partial [Lachnospiraceae bacterium]|nr:class I SAM-dependent methyltransferase [Lachnospiraceae bacterium]